MSSVKKRIAIDFDGVIIDRKGIPRKPDLLSDGMMENAEKGIRYLQELGYECFVFTARGKDEWPEVTKWLKRYQFPDLEVTNIKMNAVAYIDDRAIRFTNWQDICKYFG